MKTVTIKIMNREKKPQDQIVDIEKELSDPNPRQRFFFYSNLLGETMALQTLLDAEYRQERARYQMKMLTEDPKVSEWKVRAGFEQTPQFLNYKKGESEILKNILVLSGILDCLYWGKPSGGKVQRSMANLKEI